MSKKIRGNHDGPNGENQSYSAGTKTVSRKRMADAVDAGLYPGYHTVKVGRKRFVRANPDGNTRNNVDQG